MRNNKSVANLTAPNFSQPLSVKPLLSPGSRKIQGFDKTTSSQTFASKIDKLRTKPKVQVLQDQYISGLQDEIKYLQMELKLLQQKDLQRHGQIDQLEKFFGDGIPINENILAIKNGFNNYKQTNQKKVKQLTTEKKQRATLIESLAVKVEKLKKDLNNNQKDNRISSVSCQQDWFKIIGQEAAFKKRIEKQEQQLKAIKQQNRKLSQKIQKITRNKIIDNITVIKQQNNKMNKINYLKEAFADKQAQLLELQNQYAALEKEEEDKSYIIKLEEQNLNQRKKIIILERQQDNIKSKIKEKSIELQEKLKQRMAEISSKMDVKNKVDDLKQEISKQNGITIQYVVEIARNKEIEHLKKIVDNNKTLAKYTDHYTNILNQIENSIENLAQRKPEVKSQINAYSQDLLKLKNKLQNEKQREINIIAELTQLQEQQNETKAAFTPLEEKLRKSNDQIHAYVQQRKRLIQQIKVKEKQLQLIFVLKSLNFEETQISKASNRNLQQELSTFLKQWQKIQKGA